MKIIFSKNNYYFERNEGIEPTTSNWNVRILPSELIPHLVPETGLEPVQAFSPRDFLTTIVFTTTNNRSTDYQIPNYFIGLRFYVLIFYLCL